MSVLSVYTQIQAVVAGSSGILKAPTVMPVALNDSDLPCALCFPGVADWTVQAGGYKRHERTYVERVFVFPVAQGIGADERFQKVLPIMDALGRTILNNLSLSNTVDFIQAVRCSGVRTVEHNAIPYIGFELTFNVVEKGT